MRRQIFMAALAMWTASGWGQEPKSYDGKWWASAQEAEKSGFLNGSCDCLTWVAKQRWIAGSIEYAVLKINEYYKTHPAARALPVVDVWRKVLSKTPPDPPREGGEVYTNAHGYYDGQYWREGSHAENIGFLEGYLWCLRTRLQPPTETYSRLVSYYAKRIDEYLKKHPKADDLSIASILAHFKDKAE